MSARVLCAAIALAVAPLAHADDCVVELGRGWSPSMQNYGEATERLLVGERTPALSLTQLPKSGVERSLQLVPADRGDWTLRYAVADQRVSQWGAVKGGVAHKLVTEQTPEVLEAPIPAAVGTRMVLGWKAALESVAPAERAAAYHDSNHWTFVVDGGRFTGQAPTCGPTERLLEQLDILIEAVDESPEKRQKRWRQLDESLETMRVELYEAGQAAAGATHAND